MEASLECISELPSAYWACGKRHASTDECRRGEYPQPQHRDGIADNLLGQGRAAAHGAESRGLNRNAPQAQDTGGCFCRSEYLCRRSTGWELRTHETLGGIPTFYRLLPGGRSETEASEHSITTDEFGILGRDGGGNETSRWAENGDSLLEICSSRTEMRSRVMRESVVPAGGEAKKKGGPLAEQSTGSTWYNTGGGGPANKTKPPMPVGRLSPPYSGFAAVSASGVSWLALCCPALGLLPIWLLFFFGASTVPQGRTPRRKSTYLG
ncbi:uncharacterized protein LY79DRAFT_662067 [Colletotrichum navitas]|uniref:Uncharacterized protein n=1 Tax=Colletotrichum navitas TaxID=681940 RepID=A0AAD8PQX8_9PEZI|nr:uncharacterized protein LY79DRAFT_662067 [Colletotrichum navitas]KAK1574702.1 hypothetical protein LY79DRAFT_662067 [Colletotrichum navitas]